jgi:hypothetical protein
VLCALKTATGNIHVDGLSAPNRVALFLFWPIWIAMTAGAAICVACVVGGTASPIAQKASINFPRTEGQIGSRGAVTALTLLAFFLAGYIAMILVWANFAYPENSIFTLYTLSEATMGELLVA